MRECGTSFNFLVLPDLIVHKTASISPLSGPGEGNHHYTLFCDGLVLTPPPIYYNTMHVNSHQAPGPTPPLGT